MKKYKDFLRTKRLLENSNSDNSDNSDNFVYNIYNEYLKRYDDSEGFYPRTYTFFAKKEDIINGELIPELCADFRANIIADDIGLTSLKHFPSIEVKNLNVSENELIDLKYCPTTIDGYFICDTNKITSLEYGPNNIHEKFVCANNELTDLKGFPKMVGGDIDLSGNTKLTSLEGIVKEHQYELDLSGCISLKTLKHCPNNIKKLFLDNVPINSLRDLRGKQISQIVLNNTLTILEIDFYYDVLRKNNDPNKSYDQLFVDYIIDAIEHGGKVNLEDISMLDINLEEVTIDDKNKNLFKSLKNIGKFNL